MAKPISYLSNAVFLAAIHKAKKTFNEYLEPGFADYDVIVGGPADVPLGKTGRVMTDEHIPAPLRKRGKLPFPPFKHFHHTGIAVVEVGRSHWQGGFQNGEFVVDKGRIGDDLGRLFVRLVERYATRNNWRNYSYLSEMKSTALLQLIQSGLKFDESKGSNPFAFYTQVITHAFIRTLQTEHKQRDIRDEYLMDAGHEPSYARQEKAANG